MFIYIDKTTKEIKCVAEKSSIVIENTEVVEFKGHVPEEPTNYKFMDGNFILNENKVLKKIKQEKIHEINKIAQEKIVSGFISNALGSSHLYQSEPTDQLNLLSVVQTAQLTNENQPFKCSPDNGKTWEYKEHTPEQLAQVLKDGKNIKIAILEKANQLKQQVKNATSIKEVKLITWEGERYE